MDIVRSAWQEIIAADRHNDPDNSPLLLAMNTHHRKIIAKTFTAMLYLPMVRPTTVFASDFNEPRKSVALDG